MSIFLSAGEASGDTYGAQLIEALRKSGQIFFGLGGERMRQTGFRSVTDARQVAVVGLVEVVKHLPAIRKEFHRLLEQVDRQKPEAAILIDFPDFNLRLAKELHQRNIPVIYFVSPQLWAWRKGRIEQVRKYVNKMLVIFPFEEKFYREQGVDAEYVGHPLADLPQPTKQVGMKPSIALLPGSRKQEVELNLPEMVRAAALLGNAYRYVLPVASTLDRAWLTEKISTAKKDLNVEIELADDARVALASATVSIVASGTATVEAALAGNPFVVVYRVAPLTWMLGRRMVNLDHFAMVNLIAEKRIVPELIQQEFTAENIVAELQKVLPGGNDRERMVIDLEEVRKRLHPPASSMTASERAAQIISELMATNPKPASKRN